ncbi:MAG: penicillin-binding protein 2 [Proteobacteria bacterium]|nr:MAG: penicillin-binding protein 2 [Pseudomonadota bacterium]
MSSLGSMGSWIDEFFEQRLRLFGLVMLGFFALFVVRLFQLQVVEGDQHLERSQRNSIRTERIASPRGELTDREGRVLASTRSAFELEVVPSELRDKERTFALLGALIGEPSERAREGVLAARGRARFQPVRLADDLTFEQLARVESHRYALPGVLTEVYPRREYPYGALAAHVIGTIGEIRIEQLEERRFAGYKPGESVGQTGVESLLEPHLRGRAGGRNVIVDVAGRAVEVLDQVDPRAGGRAVLTLDVDLQQIAEDGLAAAALPGDPAAGVVVALDPRDGDVLALASLPDFDPNSFPGGIDSATWKALTSDPLKPLQDRAVAGQFPPGSTYKPFVAAVALQEKVRTPSTGIFCPGSFAFGNHTFRCWKRTGHGGVDLHRSLTQSCDVYYYRTGLEIGIDRMAKYMLAFGLGAPTGIGLENERSGVVPSSEWKQKRLGQPWYSGETVSASIGQGYVLTTPLQLAVAYGALGTGRLVKPRLVRERHAPDGAVTPEPVEVVHEVPIDAQHLERVRKGLRGVVQDGGGTGRRAQVPGLDVGGKTGTSQVVKLDKVKGLKHHQIPWKYRDHAWFAAVAPVDAPEIVVVVLVEHGGGGGANAAPVAQRVLARWWEKRNGGPGGPPLQAASVVSPEPQHDHDATSEAPHGAD